VSSTGVLSIRPTRVVTPGCQILYMDHTGCHQLAFRLQNNVKSAQPITRVLDCMHNVKSANPTHGVDHLAQAQQEGVQVEFESKL
jgi:hypothetical protein